MKAIITLVFIASLVSFGFQYSSKSSWKSSFHYYTDSTKSVDSTKLMNFKIMPIPITPPKEMDITYPVPPFQHDKSKTDSIPAYHSMGIMQNSQFVFRGLN